MKNNNSPSLTQTDWANKTKYKASNRIKNKTELAPNQSGFVAIIVTLILMVVLSLIVLGFARNSRREQRQTLDRQLNSQAFYAAESGVNDAVARLRALPPSDPIFEKSYTECAGVNSFVAQFAAPALNPNIDGTNVQYSCLLVDPQPTRLEFGSIGEQPHIIPLNGVDRATDAFVDIDNITISWQAKDGNTNFSCPGGGSAGQLVPSGNWTCETGLLRIDLVPILATVNRDNLNQNQRTLFLYPQNVGGPPASYAIGGSTGVVALAKCSNTGIPKYCGVNIDVTALPASSHYYLRLSSIYKSSAVTISVTGGGIDLGLAGAQAVVDSTGKANDVLRRIQVHVSLNPLGKGPFPGAAIQSADSICKRLFVVPGATPPVDTDTGAAGDPANPCGIN